MAFSAKCKNTAVFNEGGCLGFNLNPLIRNSSAEWVGSIQKLRKSTYRHLKVFDWATSKDTCIVVSENFKL